MCLRLLQRFKPYWNNLPTAYNLRSYPTPSFWRQYSNNMQARQRLFSIGHSRVVWTIIRGPYLKFRHQNKFLVAWFSHKYIMHGFLWSLHKDHHHKDHDSHFERNDAFFLFYAELFVTDTNKERTENMIKQTAQSYSIFSL